MSNLKSHALNFQHGWLIESLERRMLLAADLLTYHNDLASTGQNLNETVLTRANVNSSTFGKLFQFQVQGQVYAQPLVERNVAITTGPNAGTHDVVFVATEHDQLYAIDAGTLNGANSPATAGQLLWQRNFLDLSNPNNHLPSATALTTVPQADVISADISTEIGITGTPVIDPATNTLYVITKTKETVAGVGHWVQRLRAINIQDGSDRAVATIGDTTGSNTNSTQIYVYGSGSGAVTDPYNGTGRQVVQFNALREHQRPALTLVNGVVYTGWASHGDNGPYHGWMVGWDATTLAPKGVLNATPNGGLGGIWMAGGVISFDGTYFYAVTGNGTFDGQNGTGTGSNPTAPAPGPITGINAQGFPVNGDFGDSFIKIALDPTTTPQTQNLNGWGLKVVDYFTPFNQNYLQAIDLDLGSSAPVILPDSVGSAAHPHLVIGSGKEGVIYLIDRDNMGKYGLNNNVVQNTAGQLNGSFDTASYYKGRIYYVDASGGVAKTFTIANGAMSSSVETHSNDAFGAYGTTASISANGQNDGIAWNLARGANQLRAYSSDSYATELYTSDQAAGGRDTLGAAIKFTLPTVVNGHVYVSSGSADPSNLLVVYGLLQPPNAVPNAPTNLVAQPVFSKQISLSWTNNAIAPNLPDGFYVEQSSNGVSGWNQIAVVQGASYVVGGLTPGSNYYFRVRAHDSIGFSGYANTAGTTRASDAIDYSGGFASATNLTLNGGATVGGGQLHLTTNSGSQARSVFFNTMQNIASFSTTFTYTKNGLADGATFLIQRDPRGLSAVGGAGGNLAYGAPSQITPSFALAINIFNGHPFGTEFLTNGNLDFNYSQTNVNTSLNNTPIVVTINYASGNLTAQFNQGTTSETKTLSIDLPTLLGGSTAFVGFTGATGGSTATQDITNWTFDSGAAPPAPPSQPDLADASDSGASNSDNITNDNTPTLSGIAPPGSSVTILVDGQAKGSGTTAADGTFTITTSALSDGAHVITAINGASPASTGLNVTIDTMPPSLQSASFNFDVPAQNVQFNFSEDITASVQVGDLALFNNTTMTSVAPASMSVQLDGANQRATWSFPGYTNGYLPDGNYTAIIAAANVADLAGNSPTAPLGTSFFFLSADANRDHSVDTVDFNILAANFSQSGKTFSEGNFDYDSTGSVDTIDFNLLAANFGKTLAAAAAIPLVLPAASSQSVASHLFSEDSLDRLILDV